MEQYTWAANPVKLARAINNSSTKTEEDIKRLYVSYAGLLVDGDGDGIIGNEDGDVEEVKTTKKSKKVADVE